MLKQIPNDPFGALAWRACLVSLALEKIRQGKVLDSEEHEALMELSKDASNLATVMRQGATALLLKLDDRLFELSLGLLGVNLDRLREGLCHVVENLPLYPTVLMDDALMERLQENVQKLIERVNLLRPQPERSPLINCVA